jgi:hypothetical protein
MEQKPRFEEEQKAPGSRSQKEMEQKPRFKEDQKAPRSRSQKEEEQKEEEKLEQKEESPKFQKEERQCPWRRRRRSTRPQPLGHDPFGPGNP